MTRNGGDNCVGLESSGGGVGVDVVLCCVQLGCPDVEAGDGRRIGGWDGRIGCVVVAGWLADCVWAGAECVCAAAAATLLLLLTVTTSSDDTWERTV